MRFDLIDLKLFAAIAEEGSISAGASRSTMSVAAASARISGMEALLGIELFDRHRRGVELTKAGLVLLQHARQVTTSVERMRADLSTFSRSIQGSIHIVSNTAGLVDLIPRALKVFLKNHPNVSIDIDERTSGEILLTLKEQRAEIGLIGVGPESGDIGDLESLPLMTDRLSALVSRGHPLAKKSVVAFAELVNEPFVGLSAGAVSSRIIQYAKTLGYDLDVRVRLRSFDNMARLVEAGVGVGIVPGAAGERLNSDRIAIIPLLDEWAQRELRLCAQSFEDLSVPVKLLVTELRLRADEICREHNER